MQNKYRDLASAGVISIGQCLNVIRSGITNSARGYIAFGNTYLYNNPEDVTMIGISNNQAVELYSPDGYETLEDIAHWADIVEDFNACIAAGNDKYLIAWNLPNFPTNN